MKIGDVIVGKNYGAVDEPAKRHYSGNSNPRKVRVLEIVTVEEEYWSGSYSVSRQKRNVRRVKIQLLDEAQPSRSYYRNKIASAEKDTTLVVEARQIVGAWTDLSPAIHARIREEQAKLDLTNSLRYRLETAGFAKLIEDYDVRVHVRSSERPEVEFNGVKAVEALLTKLGV